MRRLLLILSLLAFAPLCRAQTITNFGPIATADVTLTFTNGNPVIAASNVYTVGQLVWLFTTGALPTGFATATNYCVIQANSSTLELSATCGGSAITPSSAGSGVQTATIMNVWPATGNPRLGDVYQIQGTITANYTTDDAVNNTSLVVTDPTGLHTLTTGGFLYNVAANGLNTFAARVAAGCYMANGICTWESGVWSWTLTFKDYLGNTGSASGSYTVASTWGSWKGFIRQIPGQTPTTPMVETDGNGVAFFGMGGNLFLSPFNPSTNQEQFGEGEIPCGANITVSGGTSVSVNSFTNGCAGLYTTALATGLNNSVYICYTANVCTPFWNITNNTSTTATLSTAATNGTYQAYFGFERNTSSGAHLLGYVTTIPQTVAFYAQWGDTLDRYHDGNGGSAVTFLNTYNHATGENNYLWNTANSAAWGIPYIDLYLAAAHAAGDHIDFGNANSIANGPCTGTTCTTAEQLNLNNVFGYEAARWGAFVDQWEAANEQVLPQVFTDYIGLGLETGVTGINGGNPADPYGHFFTVSQMPNNPAYYSPTYGPFSSPFVSDPYINALNMSPHFDKSGGNPYQLYASNQTNTEGCPGNGSGGLGGSTLFRFQGEGYQGTGITPSSQSAATPNNDPDGQRVAQEYMNINECAEETEATAISDQMAYNSSTPVVSNSWYDQAQGWFQLQAFLNGIDTAAVPLTPTLSGGCAASKCSTAALGSNSHIRASMISATTSGSNIAAAVTGGVITLTIPEALMPYCWVNPWTGGTSSCGTTAGSAGSQSFTAPNFAGAGAPPEIWFKADAPAATTLGTGLSAGVGFSPGVGVN